ncbi:hypothetical protein SteCoe_8003 [Stentor coeruleus]|uniref:Vacuolar protein 14 C-terminal Fig4-binding domain-containing protein n=1 Tax=Stentor coeruleus TaxID=5963 RepID=A0A1R2CL43_9CILI|nr:hypothetical protein SteCoe_8003 [Stentor coeruleus]
MDRSLSEASFGVMTERLLSLSSASFPIKKEIPAQVLKQLIDKSNEKRKQAGYDLQKILLVYTEKGNIQMIQSAIEMFKVDYIESSLEILKKAGLMAFSAISSIVIVSDEFLSLTPFLIYPVISCFRDNDCKIRYSAIETMYNISKSCKIKVLESFDTIFRPMSDLFADNDQNVKKAVEKLDSLLKTLVVECEANTKIFSIHKFMQIIREMVMSSTSHNVQKLLVSWLIVLDSIPNFSLIGYLSYFFEGVFLMLASKMEPAKKSAFSFLSDIKKEILHSIYGELDLLFVMQTLSKLTGHINEGVRIEAITWTSELLDKSDKVLFKIFPIILSSTLQCLADTSPKISEKAANVNIKLLNFFKTTNRETTIHQFEQTVEVLMQFINHESKVTKESILEWIISLQAIHPESIESKLEQLLETLSSRITDPEESVVEGALQVLCTIADYKGYFDKVISMILKLFSHNLLILDQIAEHIIPCLCKNLGTEAVYKSMATMLMHNQNQKFVEKTVGLLHELILIDPSLEDLREKLKHCIENEDYECIEFFEVLFKAWCFNPVSALSLTFLVQAYELSYEMLHIVSRSLITSELLTQLARFVQFLNSPAFVYLRLQLLNHYKYPYLLKSLYAILMILPNSRAYSALKVRLKDVAALHKNLPVHDEQKNTKVALIRVEELSTWFAGIIIPSNKKLRITMKTNERLSIFSNLSEDSKICQSFGKSE